MILCGIPVAFRQVHRQTADVLAFPLRSLFRTPARPLVLVYFSCARDFEILRLSLLSLSRISDAVDIHQVVVVADAKGPFSPEQGAALEQACPGLRMMVGAGEVHDRSAITIRTELNAFAAVAESAPDECIIGKVDSDILFFSPWKLRQVVRSRAAFIGDKHWSGGDFFQGGLYFMDSRRLIGIDRRVSDREILTTIERLGCSAEDRVISAIVANGASTWNTNLMLFPDEFDRANFCNPFVRWEYCALHFFACKALMPEYFERLHRLPRSG